MRRTPSRFGSLVSVLCVASGCAAEAAPPASDQPAAPLFTQIEYRFVGDRGEVDEDGWTLLWVADMEGDLSAEARWYFLEPNPIPDLPVEGASFAYYEARWEIRANDRVILAGRSAGKTVTREGEDGVWDGHGVVTEASGPYRAYLGRRIYETGPVVMTDEVPWGRGLFTIH